MKFLILSIFVALPATSFAAKYKCADQAVKKAVKTNFSNFGVNTNSCGIKALNIGDFCVYE